MSKKNFTGGLGSLLGETASKIAPGGAIHSLKKIEKFEDTLNKDIGKPKKVGRPKTQFKEITKSSQEGTREGETRATFIVKEELLDKLKAIAYWERSMLKGVINSALQEAIDKYEKKNGSIKAIPKK